MIPPTESGPVLATITSRSSTRGTESAASTRRMQTTSVQPPAYPAIAPHRGAEREREQDGGCGHAQRDARAE